MLSYVARGAINSASHGLISWSGKMTFKLYPLLKPSKKASRHNFLRLRSKRIQEHSREVEFGLIWWRESFNWLYRCPSMNRIGDERDAATFPFFPQVRLFIKEPYSCKAPLRRGEQKKPLQSLPTDWQMSHYPFRHSTYFTGRDPVYTSELPVRIVFRFAMAPLISSAAANEQHGRYPSGHIYARQEYGLRFKA
jgi:hypothetical protein